MNISQAVTERILELCRQNAISLNKLCTLSAVPYTTANEAVNGITKNIGIVTLKKLCDGLGITITDFFDTDVFRKLDQELK